MRERKKTLVGIFDQIASPQVPFPINSIGLCAKMVEGSGPYDIRVRMVNLKDESPIFQIEAKAQWNNPDDPMELGFNFAGIPVREFGTYEIQLFANDVFIGRALVKAKKLEAPPTGPARR